MDLFSQKAEETNETHQPFAHRARPQNLDDVIGQEILLKDNSPLKRWIERDQIPSMIFWGPPGCGKTTLAKVIAGSTHHMFESLSATQAGVKDIKEIVKKAKDNASYYNKRTIVFIDEIHRFNKGQQDALLPHVEDGTITLIGATTENPSFSLNTALLSRSRLITFNRLSNVSLNTILKNAISRLKLDIHFADEALDLIANFADGDARKALSLLDLIFLSSPSKQHEFSTDEVQEILTKGENKALQYDRAGDEHYNIISAFIKSMRSSDVDASLYYVARMLESGEDPIFIARRMTVFASEDIGNADPRALQVALNVKEAIEFIGMPEARINIGQGVVYLALAPKSNSSYVAIDKAFAEVRESGSLPVPLHLRNAPTSMMKSLGYGKDYQYAHSHEGSNVKQRHLPDDLANKSFYEPKEVGFEKNFKIKWDQIKKNFK